MKKCKHCGKELDQENQTCTYCGKWQRLIKVPIFLLLGIIIIVVITITINPKDDDNNILKSPDKGYEKYEIEEKENTTPKNKVTVINFSTMSKEEIDNWCQANKIDCKIDNEYSDIINKGNFIKQDIQADMTIFEGEQIIITYSLGKKPTKEQLNALEKAKSYSKNLHMSKKAIYDQLVSEYGEQFTPEAAQYAIDNIVADWNANALEKAKSYQDNLHMSKKAIYDQLISEYGEQFTPEEAQYAIDHLED